MSDGKEPKMKWVGREVFIEDRYKRFQQKQKVLTDIQETWSDQKIEYVMADLNREFTPGTPLKNVILCDRCNKNIEDEAFVSLEHSMVYHGACVEKESWYKPMSTDLREIMKDVK